MKRRYASTQLSMGLLVALCLIGCNKKEAPERHVNIIRSGGNVEIVDSPDMPKYDPDTQRVVIYQGNIDILSRILRADVEYGDFVIGHIKGSNESSWEMLNLGSQEIGAPQLYVDLVYKEIRFRNCTQGWAYCVYVIKDKGGIGL